MMRASPGEDKNDCHKGTKTQRNFIFFKLWCLGALVAIFMTGKKNEKKQNTILNFTMMYHPVPTKDEHQFFQSGWSDGFPEFLIQAVLVQLGFCF